MKFAKKTIPYAVVSSLAVAAVVAPTPSQVEAAQAGYEAGFYIEKDGVLKYYNPVEFALLPSGDKEAYVLDSAQFVFVDGNTGKGASVTAIFSSGSVNSALTEIAPGLIKEGSYTKKDGTTLPVEEPTPEPVDFTVESIAAITKTTVEVTLSDVQSEAPKAEDFTVTVGDTVIPVTKVELKSGTTKTYTLSVALDKKEGKVVINGKESSAFDFKAPEVTSVTPLAQNLLEVKFSEDVNAGLAQLTANYGLVETGTANVISVSSVAVVDAKTVRITTANQTKDKNYTLTVRNIQDLSANKNAMTSQSVTFTAVKDEVNPTIVSAKGIDANLFEVTMSEELRTATAVSVDVRAYNEAGTAVVGDNLADGATVTISGNKVTVQTSTNAFANGKKYKVTLTGGADLSGNAIAANQAIDITGVRDVTAPVVASQEFKNGKLTIHFSKPMVNLGQTGNYAAFETETGLAATVQSVQVANDNKSVTLTFNPALDGNKQYTVRLTGWDENEPTRINGLRDNATVHNALANNTLVRFTTPAAVVPVQLTGAALPAAADKKDGKTVVLTFNTSLNKAEAENVTNYLIANASDASKTLSVEKAVYNADNNTVTLTTAAQADVNYRVTVSNLSNLNVNAASQTFIGEDKVKPNFTEVVVNNLKSLDLKFDKDLKTSDQDVYTIAIVETGTANVVNVSSATRTFSGKTLRLTLPADVSFEDGKNYTITVVGVKDTATAANQSPSRSLTFTAKADTTPAQLTNVEVVNEGKIVLQFNEEISNAGSISNFELKQGTNVVNLTGFVPTINPSNKTQIVIEHASTPTAFLENAKNYTLSISGGVQDLAGNYTTNASYSFVGYKDVIAPKFVKAVAKEDNLVVLTFDEAISLTAASESNFVVTNAVTGERLIVDNASVGSDGKTIELTLDSKTVLGTQYRVFISGDVVKDRAVNPNALDAATRVQLFDGVDTTAPEFAGVELVDTKTIKVTFDEKLSEGTVTAAAFDVKLSGVAQSVTSAQLSASGTVVTLTLSNALATTSVTDLSVGIKADKFISDLSGNKLEGPNLFAGAIVDKAAPTLVAYEITDTSEVTLTFSENVTAFTTADTVAIANLVEIVGYTVATAVATGDNKVVLTTTATIEGTPTIILKAGQALIKDAANNMYTGADVKVLIVNID